MASKTHENVYLGRIASSHLYEAATFLRKSYRQVEEVKAFVDGLPESIYEAHQRLVEVGEGDDSEFALDLKHARNKSFHYQRLVVSEGENYEVLKAAMKAFAEDEVREGTKLGVIEDRPPLIEGGFRAVFADDIAVEMSLRVKEDHRLGELLKGVSERTSDYIVFAKGALSAYVDQLPKHTWQIEEV